MPTKYMFLVGVPLLLLLQLDWISVRAETNTRIPTSTCKHGLPRTKNNHWIPKRQQRRRHSTTSRGTLFSFRRPTIDLASQWFATDNDNDDIMFHSSSSDESIQELFNHDSVGMTNPCLHIDLTSPNKDNNDDDIHKVVTCSTTTTTTNASPTMDNNNNSDNNIREDLDKLWWPFTSMNEKMTKNGKRIGKNKSGTWRVLRYHRRVGKGEECYERVRDAALEWSFGDSQQDNTDSSNGDERGILRLVPTESINTNKKKGLSSSSSSSSPASSMKTQPILREEAHMGGVYNVVHNSFMTDGTFELNLESSKNVAQIWSGPQRKLVTFSATNLLGKVEDKLFSKGRRRQWKPKVYAVNPVMVVYDLVDQRGPSTTFTSTAYATMKGHLLSGECRQTVALRDGIGEEVDIEILSYCRPAPTLWGKIVWPFITPMQTKFFESHMDHLEHVAAKRDCTNSGSRREKQSIDNATNQQTRIISASCSSKTSTPSTLTRTNSTAKMNKHIQERTKPIPKASSNSDSNRTINKEHCDNCNK